MKFNRETFLNHGTKAVLASMGVILPFIKGVKDYGDIEVKEHDQTLVTAVDRMSEDAASEILIKAFPNVPIIREEGGISSVNPDATWIKWFDGLDGTNIFTLGGATPTVILSAYDLVKKQLVGCIVGEPSTGRVWSATSGSGCDMDAYNYLWDDGRYSSLPLTRKKCQAWDGEVEKGTVMIDISHGFTRGKGENKRQLMTEDNMDKFLRNVRSRTKVLLLGSNGINHALVANGNKGMAGCISTAMGGPWDTPTLLSAEAGGFGRAFRVTSDRKLEEADFLDPEAYDMVIVSGSKRTLDFLSACLTKSFEC